MFSISYSHNGVAYNNLDQTFESAIIKAVKEIIDEKLEVLSEEINRENGSIQVSIVSKNDNQLELQISTEGFSNQLDKKIIAAFS